MESVVARSAAVREARATDTPTAPAAPTAPDELVATINHLQSFATGDCITLAPNLTKLTKSRAHVETAMKRLQEQQQQLADSPHSASAAFSPRSPQPVPPHLAKGVKRRNSARQKLVASVDSFAKLVREEQQDGYYRQLGAAAAGFARPAKRARTAAAAASDTVQDSSDDDATRPAKRARTAAAGATPTGTAHAGVPAPRRRPRPRECSCQAEAAAAVAVFTAWQEKYTPSVAARGVDDAMGALRAATVRALDEPGGDTAAAIKEALQEARLRTPP